MNVVEDIKAVFQGFAGGFKMIGINTEPRGKRRFLTIFNKIENIGQPPHFFRRIQRLRAGARRFRADVDQGD